MWVGGCHFKVSGANPLVECSIVLAVYLKTGELVSWPASAALQTHFNGQIQQNGAVGLESVRGDVGQTVQRIQWRTCAVPLVGQRGIGESIGYHRLTRVQRRSDDVVDKLATRRVEKKRVRDRVLWPGPGE
jgi:hypothetical protein